MVERPRRASGGQLVYTELRRRILDLELRPGQRLYEPELSAELQVSRTPFVRRCVCCSPRTSWTSSPGRHGGASAVRHRDRGALLGSGRARGARRPRRPPVSTPPARSGCARWSRNERLVELPEDAMNAGHDFHLAIAEVAGHSWASRLHGQVDGQMARYRAFTNQSRSGARPPSPSTQAILTALVDRDGRAASSPSSTSSRPGTPR